MFPVVPGLFPGCSQSIPLSFIVFPVFRVFRVRYIAWGWCNTLLRHRNTGNSGNKAVSTMSCSVRHQEQIGNRSGNTVRFGRSAGRPNGVPAVPPTAPRVESRARMRNYSLQFTGEDIRAIGLTMFIQAMRERN
jgi:hypothetical protein